MSHTALKNCRILLCNLLYVAADTDFVVNFEDFAHAFAASFLQLADSLHFQLSAHLRRSLSTIHDFEVCQRIQIEKQESIY